MQDRSVREKLNGMFSRYDYVGVVNILKVPFEWSVALEQNELLGSSPTDGMNEQRMASSQSGSFLPGDSITKVQQKITKFTLQPGEKRMIIGEAAYVIVPRIFNAHIREQFGSTKSSLAKLRNPAVHDEIIPKIAVGPIINNVADAMQTYVNNEVEKIENFTDIQTKPKGFSDPAVLAKAQETRRVNQAKKAQPA